MKKKLIIVLTVFSLLAILGGVNLIVLIGRSASHFDKLIELHQVEILREHLLLNVYQVQEDLYSQTTWHPESYDAILHHIEEMNTAVNTCFGCHHTADVMERLEDLRRQIDQYSHALSRIMTVHGNAMRGQQERERAHIIGESLISKVNTMIVLTNRKLNKQTEESLDHLHSTKIVVILLVAAGPLMVALLAVSATRGITKPIQTLLTATKRLKTGNLDYRIAGLKDEFAELALAFNDMAGALREHMQTIQESEKRYRLLFESAGDAIFILEAEGGHIGKIVQANEAAAKMHGYSVDELMGMNIKELDSPGAASSMPARIERLNEGERIQTEITHVKKDGTVFPVEISAVMFEVAGRKYILAIDRDITERKKAEVALQSAERSRIAGELATGLAHEIKNPLSGIMVSMEALSDESDLSEENRDILRKVIKEIKRIEFLMNGLLKFARPPKPQFEKTNVNEVLDAVASLVLKERSRSRNGERPIQLVRDLEGNLPEIMADPMQLEQIFMNLFLNAVDAMPAGGTLTIKTALENDSLRIDLSDTGRGIDASVISKIFQPFFTTKSKGTGLGLAITRRLVEEHGGTINLQKNAEGGATFIVHLPINQRGGVAA